MGFLNPVFLIAGAAVLVPLFLHLLYRQESKTFSFPAIRYLLRTERDHARQIRTQQLLLLLLRAAMVALVVALGARIHFPGPGGSHDPTALALVIDNSMSAAAIEDGRRRLDTIKAAARISALGAGHEDVIWVVRAGEPWEPSRPGGAAEALAAIEAVGPSHARGDLVAAVERAGALVEQSDLPNREVHLFTDLQATGFGAARHPRPDLRVVVFGAPAENARNRGIADVSFGGGLAPLAGRRTEVAVAIGGAGDTGGPDGAGGPGGAGDAVGVRLYVGGELKGAARGPVGAVVTIPAGPFAAGRVEGHVEIDPDPLTADDRRFFSFAVREPTVVAVLGEASVFVTEALAVLEEGGRVSLGGAAGAGTLISIGGEGLERRGLDQNVVVAPHPDAARLPALNRRLAAAGIPFRYEGGEGGGARVAASDLDFDVLGIEARRFFRIAPTEGGADGGLVQASPAPPAATLSSGDPWLLTGSAATGPYVLLASPLDENSTTLPVSAAMVPLLEWAIERWSGGSGDGSIEAGSSFRPPAAATAVRDPGGAERPVDGDQPFLATGKAGFYAALAGDSILARVPVNPPAVETDLTPASAREVRRALPGVRAVVDDAGEWTRHIFRAGRGPEPWRLLAALLLALLAVEAAVAAARGLRA